MGHRPLYERTDNMNLPNLKYNNEGLIPAIIQDADTNEVLMLGYMNHESLKKSIETGRTVFWSRSRKKLWTKGETSGHFQLIKEMLFDCDNDTLLIKVKREGPSCHTGNISCFYRKIGDKNSYFIAGKDGQNTEESITQDPINRLYATVKDRKENPKEGSYTNYLFEKGLDKILKKIGEEAAEVIIASKNPDKNELIYETADLLYHLAVLLAEKDVTPDNVYSELKGRQR